MEILTTVLYLMAVGLSAYALFRQIENVSLVVCLLSLFLMMEGQGWFLTRLFDGAGAWPAHSLTEVLAAAYRGVSVPTTILELSFVAIGRLMALLSIFYGAVFLYYYGRALYAGFMALLLSFRALFGLWVGSNVIAALIQILVILPLMPIAGVLQVLGGVCALLLAAMIVFPDKQQKPAESQ